MELEELITAIRDNLDESLFAILGGENHSHIDDDDEMEEEEDSIDMEVDSDDFDLDLVNSLKFIDQELIFHIIESEIDDDRGLCDGSLVIDGDITILFKYTISNDESDEPEDEVLVKRKVVKEPASWGSFLNAINEIISETIEDLKGDEEDGDEEEDFVEFDLSGLL